MIWPMSIVSNTSPILNLAIISRLDLLRQQFGVLIVPPAVIAECQLEAGYPGSNLIKQAVTDGWIQEVGVHNQPLVQALRLELDAGEAEAIALAIERSEEQILIDEREGRQKAKALGLTPVGILGVLLQARQDMVIDSISDAIQALQQQAGFRLAPDLVSQILQAVGEQ